VLVFWKESSDAAVCCFGTALRVYPAIDLEQLGACCLCFQTIMRSCGTASGCQYVGDELYGLVTTSCQARARHVPITMYCPGVDSML